MSPSAGLTSHRRYFSKPLQALMASKYGSVHHCVLSDVLLVQSWGRRTSSCTHPPHLIVRYRIWYSWIFQNFTGCRCLVLFNARGTILTLWKYTQDTCSCVTFGLSFISRTTTALQGVRFQWMTCCLTLLFITTDYNCEQAFWGRAELRGDWQWQLWHSRSSVPKAPCLASPRCIEAKFKMSKISTSMVLVL